MRQIISILVLVLFQKTYSEKPSSSIYTDLNRSLVVSPQSAGLGGADLSLDEGALPRCSPSNLTRDSLNLLSLSYANYFGNTFSTSVLSFVNHLNERSAFSVAAGYILIPDIEDNRNLDTNESGHPRFDKPVEVINCSQIYFRAGYGFSSAKDRPLVLSTGVSVNGSRIRLIDYNGYGVGLDIGSGVTFNKPGIALTLLLENAVGSYTYWNSSYSEYGLPHLRFGFGWEKSFRYLYGNLKIGFTSPDLLSNEGINHIGVDEETDELLIEKIDTYSLGKEPSLFFTGAKYGIEYKILNVVAIRSGFSQDRFSFGAGLSVFAQRAGVDFAYILHSLSGTYQISLAYRW